MTQLWQLYRLQQTDLQIQELTKRKGSLDTGEEKLKEQEEVREKIARTNEEFRKTQMAMKRLELDVGSNEEHQKRLQGNLWSGKSTNPKELSGWQKEIEQLKAQQKKIEDNIIEKMELLENMEQQVKEEELLLIDIERSCNLLREQYESDLAKIEVELEAAQKKRETFAEGIEPHDLRRYEALRSSKGGIAIVKIAKNNCGGCFRNLPEPAVRKAQARQMEFCNACGRILYAEGE